MCMQVTIVVLVTRSSGQYGVDLNFSTPVVAIFVLRKFHYD